MSKLQRLHVPFLILLLVCCWVVPASAQPPDFVALAEQLKPSVVNIGAAKTVKPRAPTFRGREPLAGAICLMSFSSAFSVVHRSRPARLARSAQVLLSLKTAIS